MRQSNHHENKNLGFFATFLRLRMSLFQDHTWLFLSVTRKLFRGGELVTTVILGSACFPLGFVDSRNSLLNQRPREGNGACL